MLNVTDNAQAVVKGLAEQSELPEEGGLRLSFTENESELQVSLAPQPEETDQVVEGKDARVFVAEETAPALDGQTLDATQTDEGVGFTLQPSE